jgi:ABC-type Zn uptake system ZnuABC Zn-binding protein ZnuA
MITAQSVATDSTSARPQRQAVKIQGTSITIVYSFAYSLICNTFHVFIHLLIPAHSVGHLYSPNPFSLKLPISVLTRCVKCDLLQLSYKMQEHELRF